MSDDPRTDAFSAYAASASSSGGANASSASATDDPRTDAFASYAAGKEQPSALETASAPKTAMELLQERHTRGAAADAALNRAMGGIPGAILETGAQAVTGAGALVAGAWNATGRALYDVATGHAGDASYDAAKTVDWWQQHAYQPSEPTKRIQGFVSNAVSKTPLGLLPNEEDAQDIAERVYRNTGSPLAATAAQTIARAGVGVPGGGNPREILARPALEPGGPPKGGAAVPGTPPREPYIGDLATAASAPTARVAVAGAPAAAPAAGEDAQAILNRNALESPESVGGSRGAPQLDQLPPEERAEAERIIQLHGRMNEDAFNRRLDASTLPVPITLTEGQATRDPLQWGNEYNSRAANPEIMDRLNEQEKQLKGNLSAIRDNAAPSVPAYAVSQGQIALDTDKAIDEAWRAHITGKYKLLEDAAGGAFPFDSAGWVRNTDAALTGPAKAYARFLPPEVRSMIEDYRNGEPMSFAEFEANRTVLANAARTAERAGKGNDARAINIVREQLENMPLPPEAAHLKGLANDARGEAAARFEYIRQNPSYKAAVDDPIPMGQDSPLANNYTRSYVIGGTDAHVANMRERWADHQGALDMLNGATVDHLTGAAHVTGEGGSFSQDGYNRAINKLGPKLRFLVNPETADQLEQLGRTAHYIKEAPGGAAPNRSGTFVAQAGAAAGQNPMLKAAGNTLLSGIEGWLNVHAGGIPIGTGLRWAAGLSPEAQAARQAATIEEARKGIVQRVLRPGAGLDVFPGERGTPSAPAPGGPIPPPRGGPTPGGAGPGGAGGSTPPPLAPLPEAPPTPPGAGSAAAEAPAVRPGGPAAAVPTPAAPIPEPTPGPAPGASPAATGATAPTPAAAPRSRVPSPGIQARSQELAQQLGVPPEAIDGRVRSLSTEIDRARRKAQESHTEAEQKFHGEMIQKLETERSALVARNVMQVQNPKGGLARPLTPEPEPAAPPLAQSMQGMPPTGSSFADLAAAAGRGEPTPAAAPAPAPSEGPLTGWPTLEESMRGLGQPTAQAAAGNEIPQDVLMHPHIQYLTRRMMDAEARGDAQTAAAYAQEISAEAGRLAMRHRAPSVTAPAELPPPTSAPRTMQGPATRSEAVPPPPAPPPIEAAPPPPAPMPGTPARESPGIIKMSAVPAADIAAQALRAGNFKEVPVAGGNVRLVHVEGETGARVLYAFDGKGNNIGEMTYRTTPDSHPYIEIDQPWQHRGIARAMYKEAEANGGHIPPLDAPGAQRSEQGQGWREALAREGLWGPGSSSGGPPPPAPPPTAATPPSPAPMPGAALKPGDVMPARPWRAAGATAPDIDPGTGRSEAFSKWLARGPGWPQTLDEALAYAERSTVNPDHGYARPAGAVARSDAENASLEAGAQDVRRDIKKGLITPDEGLYTILQKAGAKGLPPIEKAIKPDVGEGALTPEQKANLDAAFGGVSASRGALSDDMVRMTQARLDRARQIIGRPDASLAPWEVDEILEKERKK